MKKLIFLILFIFFLGLGIFFALFLMNTLDDLTMSTDEMIEEFEYSNGDEISKNIYPSFNGNDENLESEYMKEDVGIYEYSEEYNLNSSGDSSGSSYYREHTIEEHAEQILYFLSSFNNISVYFQNIETGFSIRYNQNYVYFSASVTKAPLALFIYTLARSGEIDLEQTITFLSEDYRGGSGSIRYTYPFGTAFSIRRLLGLNLYRSDNVATAMLMRYFGHGYRQFLISIGADHRMAHGSLTNSGLNAVQARIFANAIYEFIAEEDDIYSYEFKRNLLANIFPFIVSSYPVASKTGWTQPIAWHDMAIVYAPSPYILVILSSRVGWTDADYRDFYEISMKFERFNNTWFRP